MSAKALSWVMENSPYSDATRLIHFVIADVANDAYNNEVWLSEAQIAKRANCTVRTVSRAKAQMIRDGYLEKVRDQSGRAGGACYRLSTTHDICDIAQPEPTTSTTQPTTSAANALLYKPKNLSKEQADAEFAQFWATYPRHEAKAAARRAWDKAIALTDPMTIILAATKFRSDPNRTDQFTPHPASWLNGQRWEDDPLPPRDSASPQLPSRAPYMAAQAPEYGPEWVDTPEVVQAKLAALRSGAWKDAEEVLDMSSQIWDK